MIVMFTIIIYDVAINVIWVVVRWRQKATSHVSITTSITVYVLVILMDPVAIVFLFYEWAIYANLNRF